MSKAKETRLEVQAPTLESYEAKAEDVMDGTIYMVDENIRFPIHPEPDADHKIAKLMNKDEIIVVAKNNDSNSKYLKTVLPISGFIWKECTTNGTLKEVTTETYEDIASDGKKHQVFCGCIRNRKCIRQCEVRIRKQPICVFGIIALLHFLAEVVIFADLITDVWVAITLEKVESNVANWLFMLTCVFILAPYYIAWAAAFGYLQKKAMESTAQSARKNALIDAQNKDAEENKDENGNNVKKVKRKSAPSKRVQFGVLIFSIAPIGVVILVFLDVYLLIEDLIIKPVYLCLTGNPIREESNAELGYKKLRRVSEVVAETICQTVLQAMILWLINNTDDSKLSEITKGPIIISLVVSIAVLLLWGTVLKIESIRFALHFYEYVTVVLQGSFNFVPFLPAIERGKKKKVNWTDFRFDSHSVGLVSKALISPDCELEQIKLSGYSLAKLTQHECRFLGQMLADSPKQKDGIGVVFSRSRREIEELFNQFDTDKSRTFDFKEFTQLCSALRQNDDGKVNIRDVAKIFSEIADMDRREIYLTDLLIRVSLSSEKIEVVDYDSPVMYALKKGDRNLLAFMMAAKVVDDLTFEYYTSSLVMSESRHEEALMMCEEKGIPIVIEILSSEGLPAQENNSCDAYCGVSVKGQVKRTETQYKNLNPIWNQALLFLIEPEDIPENLENNNERLEINFKVYHFDDEGDDFFIGSYKHFLKWNINDLIKHQNINGKNKNPLIIDHDLRSKSTKVGSLKFRIYTGTLQWYDKYVRNAKDNIPIETQ